MVAKEKPELLEATKTLYQYNHEEDVIWQCWAREDYENKIKRIRRDKEMYETKIAEQEAAIEGHKFTIAEQEAAIEGHKFTIAEQETTIAKLQAEIERLKNQK